MQSPPLTRIARNSRRLNIILFGVLPLVLVMGGILYAGFQRIIDQEQERIAVDFSLLTLYMAEQEILLKRLDQKRIIELGNTKEKSTGNFRVMDQQLAQGATLFRGSNSSEETPFSLVCEDISSCPLESAGAASLGRYLADLYSSFWVESGYPASTLIIVDTDKSATYTVPFIDSARPRMPASLIMASIAAIRANATVGDEIRWVGLKGFPDYMIAYTLIHGADIKKSTSKTFAATLAYRNRVNIFSTPLKRSFYDDYWLESKHDGLLLGNRPLPDVTKEVTYGADGLVFKIDDESAKWTGYYLLSYGNLLRGYYWLMIFIAVILLLSPVAGWFYVLWYQRRVILPAQRAHIALVESDEFSRTLLETSPIALCVLDRGNSQIIFANGTALKWFDIHVGGSLQDIGLDRSLLDQIVQAKEQGVIEHFKSADGRSFYAAFTPARYRNQNVVISAFVDLSVRRRLEQELTEAKLTADKASGAKSVFLATMSHEIRTPLYGVLGSLELMGLTNLDHEQQQLLERIQVSSGLLLQIISDILDITKIESDQLALGEQVFDPVSLVQSCTAAHIDLAQKKELLLFSSIEPDVPTALRGDPGRIRQILTNLISNAIKFTLSGHIIVRLRIARSRSGHVTLLLQVSDTGVGISKEEQKSLFSPFYQIDANTHSVNGAGLGLSISAKLAVLMGSEICVTSEKGLGSSFSLHLELPIVTDAPITPLPDLRNARIYVQSPHHELTDNLCQWLIKWGAQASTFEEAAIESPNAILVCLNGYSSTPPLPKDSGMTRLNLGSVHGERNINVTNICDFTAIGFLIERTLKGEHNNQQVNSSQNVLDKYLPPLRLNLLIAEDNEINQATLCHQLKQLGCTTTLANDGVEALEIWRLGNFDLLLTDVNMPRMNGYDLAVAIRAEEDDRPIIGITANAMSDEEDRCKAAGMDTWLVKPVQLRTLWDSLARLSAFDATESEEALQNFPAQTNGPDALPDDFREIFINTMKMDLEKLQQAIDEKQYDYIFHLLHRIRGSLAIAGYEQLIEQIENFSKNLRKDGLTEATYAQSAALLSILQDISRAEKCFQHLPQGNLRNG
ncbi:sensor histidine kinase RcsC [Pseudomonas sp. DD1]|uniref:hybrid sensor histidine kinase/response regulator n=1 Tax=Pseudomonas sp. DD1 TaxID=879558 RepID=UPI0037CB6AAD